MIMQRFPARAFRSVHCLTVVLMVWMTVSTTTISAQPSDSEAVRPNVMIILADDLGFSDLGCYGGEIATPNLDRLAGAGVRFSQFYNTGRCWPTRSSLLTGYYAQQVHFDDFPGQGRSSRQRPEWAPLISQVLKEQGYRCYHSGKWHLNGQPVNQGFDHSYRLADHGRFFSPRNHQLDGKPLPQPELDSGFYATQAIADYMIEFLQEHQSLDAEADDSPFFAFLAFTAPHFPLHATAEDIARYSGQYQQGWNAVRQSRMEQMIDQGLFDKSVLSSVEQEVGPPYHFPEALKKLGTGEVNRPIPWDELNAQQQSFQVAKMRIHAAMVDRMDREIGRVLEQLESMGQLDNTLFFFMSDNGASAEIMVRSDGHDPTAVAGSAKTHLCLGPGWSNACNTPFRRHKTWVHEGGTHTPLIVSGPGVVRRTGWCDQVGHVSDIFPTVMAAAGVDPADETQIQRPGQSLLPWLKQADRPTDSRTLWWLHEGNAALRMADWKLVRASESDWELFDLSQDPTEQRNLVTSQPDRAAAMKSEWKSRSEQYQADANHESRE